MERSYRLTPIQSVVGFAFLVFLGMPFRGITQSDSLIEPTTRKFDRTYIDFAFGYWPGNKIVLCDLNFGFRINSDHAVGLSGSFFGRKSYINVPGVITNPYVNSILLGVQYRYTPFWRLLMRVEAGFVSRAFIGQQATAQNTFEFDRYNSKRTYYRAGVSYRFNSHFTLTFSYIYLNYLYFSVNPSRYAPSQTNLGAFSLERLGGFCLQVGIALPGYSVN
jgi:hypothetical protein